MTITRPVSIRIEIERTGNVLVVPPLERRQMREVYALGDADGMSPQDQHAWRERLLGIYLRQARCTDAAGGPQSVAAVLDSLTLEEELLIIQAVVAAQHGHDPQTAVELQQAMLGLLKKKLATPPPATSSSPPTTSKPSS